jgi:hypothetical protein
MMYLTLTAAQLLVYLTTVCPSEVKVLPESNTTIVYKCMANPEEYPEARAVPSPDDLKEELESD